MLSDGWHVAALRRLPGTSLRALDEPLLDAVLELVELQADAGVDTGQRDFAAYQALVLFEGWDYWWRDAEATAPALCARIRDWLQPVWGLALPARDYANNDLNLTNILAAGATITGVVDWDEFGLNTRAADLAALASDCERLGNGAAVEALVARIVEIVGEDGLSCVIAYRIVGEVAALSRRGERDGVGRSVAAATLLLDRLGA